MSTLGTFRRRLAEVTEAHGLPGFGDLITGARFATSLVGYLRRPINVEQARNIVRERLARREQDFLELARDLISIPGSPYRTLLRLAGCEYGDLERMVHADGVEASLRTLYRHGVYLSVEEFKGQTAVTRGSVSFLVDPRALCNPHSTVHFVAHTSGSRGRTTAVPFDLRNGWDHAVNRCLVLESRGARSWPLAVWGMPGGGEAIIVLRFAAAGTRPERWFSQVDPAGEGLHPRYRWSGRVVHWVSTLIGVPLPEPLYVSLQDPVPIARWMRDVLDRGKTPHIKTYSSAAVRLCQAAAAAGISVEGAQFTVVGEPVTAARLEQIRRVGAAALPEYGSVDVGTLAEACHAPEIPDDMHLMHDLAAVIQPDEQPRASSDRTLPTGTLMVTSLRPTTPFVLLNYSMGDRATIAQRRCGCPMERYGWSTHLHTVRSFEKLTGEGVSFADTDVIHVLDEVLPRRFGGGPSDYQLVEGETSDGRARITLRIHPRVGPLDATLVREAFLDAIGATSGIERVMERLWREADLVTVERSPPESQASGKIQHFWVDRTRDRDQELRANAP